MRKILSILSISVLFLFQLPCEIIPFSAGGRIGFIDEKMNVVLQPNYKDICDYNKDYFVCKKMVAGIIYCEIISRDGAVLAVQKAPAMDIVYEDFFTFYTKTGMDLIRLSSPAVFYSAQAFSHSENKYAAVRTAVKSSTQHSFFDVLTGTQVGGWYRRSYGFFCRRAIVVLENWDYAFVDESFSIVKEFEFLDRKFSEGLVAGITKDGKSGYFDVEGRQVVDIPLRYGGLGSVKATEFSGGYALVSVSDGRWRIIDRTGRSVKEISCEYAERFCEGYSLVSQVRGGRYKFRFVGKDGVFLTGLEFDDAEPFCNGYARIAVNGKDGILDREGNIYLSEEILQGKKIRHSEIEFQMVQ